MTAVPDFDIRSMTFQLDGSVAIEYIGARDFKANGLQVQHVVLIPSDSDYDDELEELREVSNRVLKDAIEDLDTAEPFDFTIALPDPEEDNDDDD